MMFRPQPDDEVLVASALRELAETPLPQSPLPDPSFIWWKAQFLRRLEAEREATAPIEVGEHVHVGAAILGAAALGAGAWGHLALPVFTPLTGLASLLVLAALVLTAVAVSAMSLVRER